MNNKKYKFFGVALAFVLVFSLFASFVPAVEVTATAPGTTDNQWQVVTVPSGASVKVAAADVADMAVASDGKTVYVADAQRQLLTYSDSKGDRWTDLTSPGWVAPPRLVAVAPDNPQAIAVIDSSAAAGGFAAGAVWISNNGGTTWAQLALVPGNGVNTAMVTSIAIGPARSGTILQRDYVISVADTRIGFAVGGDILFQGFNTTWTSVAATGAFGLAGALPAGMAVPFDFMSIKIGPGFLGDRVIAAVGASPIDILTPFAGAAGDTMLFLIQLADIAPLATVVIPPGAITLDTATTDSPGDFGPGGIQAADIAIPTDWDPTTAGGRKTFVSWWSAGGAPVNWDDVYRVDHQTVRKLQSGAGGALNGVYSIAYSGTRSTGVLVAGESAQSFPFWETNVWYSSDPMSSTPSWSSSDKPPTGQAWCVVGIDAADPKLVYAGTSGMESALSRSNNGAMSFNGLGLIDTGLPVFDDVMPLPDGSKIFLGSSGVFQYAGDEFTVTAGNAGDVFTFTVGAGGISLTPSTNMVISLVGANLTATAIAAGSTVRCMATANATTVTPTVVLGGANPATARTTVDWDVDMGILGTWVPFAALWTLNDGAIGGDGFTISTVVADTGTIAFTAGNVGVTAIVGGATFRLGAGNVVLPAATSITVVTNRITATGTYTPAATSVAGALVDADADATLTLAVGVYSYSLPDLNTVTFNKAMLWKSNVATSSGSWQRVRLRGSAILGAFGYITRLSPEYTSDSTVYFADYLGTDVQRSVDGGDIFSTRTAPAAIQDIAVENKDIVYLGASAAQNVYRSTSGAWTWDLPVSTGGTIWTLAMLPSYPQKPVAGNVIRGATNGGVKYSKDGGQTWTTISPNVAGATNAQVMGDVDWANNSTFYMASATAGQGIYRWQVGKSTVWENIDPFGFWVGPDGLAGTGDDVAAGMTGLAMVSGSSVLYSSLTTGVASAAERSLTPTVPVIGAWRFLQMNVGAAAAVFNTVPSALRVAADDKVVTLWAISTTGPALFAYADAIAKAKVTVTLPETVPIDSVSGRSQQFVVKWDQLSNATTYNVDIYTDPACTSLILWAGGPIGAWPFAFIPPDPLRPSWVVPFGSLVAGMDYFVRIRIVNQMPNDWIDSNWSSVFRFAVAGGERVEVSYLGVQPLGPSAGATNVPTTKPGFTWSPYASATRYEFVLAKDAALTSVVATAKVTTTAYQYDGTLDFGTTYFWRVRGIEPTVTDWSPVASFTTAGKPTTPAPPVIVTQAPPPTPAPPVVTPAVIWAIIGIGAILVIAVLILIVRTRRTV